MEFRIITSDEQMQILTDDHMRLAWGHFFPSSAKSGVGARMILDNYSLGYVHGRVARIGKNQDLDQKTADKCIEIGLADKLYGFLKENAITSSSKEIVFGEIDR